MIIGIMSVYTFQPGWSSTLTAFYATGEAEESYNEVVTYPIILPSLPESYTLVDDDRPYFTFLPNDLSCFTTGTDLMKSSSSPPGSSSCTCLAGYYGRDCGIPGPVWHSCQTLNNCSDLKVRKTPRRLIHGLNINHELEFFQVRLEEVGDVLDVVIVGESNLTAGGDASPLYLLPELRKGFMSGFQHKIIHIFIDHFPPEGLTDGWFADTFIRDYMGQEGLKRIKGSFPVSFYSSLFDIYSKKIFNFDGRIFFLVGAVSGIRDDDLFLLLDADEIPDRNVLLFLKLYDGYPEPIALTLRWSIYGFFWKRSVSDSPHVEDVTRIVAISTMRMIRQVYDGKVMSIRRNYLTTEPLLSRVETYKKSGHPVKEWNIGEVGAYAGFHCSWCYSPEGIKLKLMSAQKDDKPRWGDFPDKLDLGYISGLIQNGRWFDNSQPFFLVKPEQDPLYAPAYILKHKNRFHYLLDPPSSNKTTSST
jgi:beta-1,4-mannosyl-glycoprotein beta-1,4-N-acetylglucosaminyltransferase